MFQCQHTDIGTSACWHWNITRLTLEHQSPPPPTPRNTRETSREKAKTNRHIFLSLQRNIPITNAPCREKELSLHTHSEKKRFCFVLKLKIAKIFNLEGQRRYDAHSVSHVGCSPYVLHFPYTKRRGNIMSLFISRLGIWRCLSFDGQKKLEA